LTLTLTLTLILTRLTSELGQTGMLAYQLRASQLKEVVEELDEGMDSLGGEGGVGGNFEVSKLTQPYPNQVEPGEQANPNPNPNPNPNLIGNQVSKATDTSRRKSVLPGQKSDESKAQVAAVATGEKLQTTYQADNESMSG